MHRPRGFTLMEAMVALGILLLAFLALSLALIEESGERIERSGRRVLDAPVSLVLDRMRAEIRSAEGIDVLPAYDPYALWQDMPLVIYGHASGGTIVYALDADAAELRRLRGASQATALRGVERFRWRFVDDVPRRVVEIELTYSVTGTYRGPSASRGAGADVSRTERLVVTPRRRVGATWW